MPPAIGHASSGGLSVAVAGYRLDERGDLELKSVAGHWERYALAAA